MKAADRARLRASIAHLRASRTEQQLEATELSLWNMLCDADKEMYHREVVIEMLLADLYQTQKAKDACQALYFEKSAEIGRFESEIVDLKASRLFWIDSDRSSCARIQQLTRPASAKTLKELVNEFDLAGSALIGRVWLLTGKWAHNTGRNLHAFWIEVDAANDEFFDWMSEKTTPARKAAGRFFRFIGRCFWAFVQILAILLLIALIFGLAFEYAKSQTSVVVGTTPISIQPAPPMANELDWPPLGDQQRTSPTTANEPGGDPDLSWSNLPTLELNLSNVNPASMVWQQPARLDTTNKTITFYGPYAKLVYRYNSASSLVVVDNLPDSCEWASWSNVADPNTRYYVQAVRSADGLTTTNIDGIYFTSNRACSPNYIVDYTNNGN